MQSFNCSFKIAPKLSKLLSSTLLKQKCTMEQVVLRGEFGCTHTANIGRQLSYGKEFNNLDGTARNTLQSRILEYFRTNSKFNNVTVAPTPTSKSSVMHNNASKTLEKHLMDLPALNHSQLAGFIHDLHHQSLKESIDERQFLDMLSVLDEECCYRIESTSSREVSTILDAWMYLLPHRITYSKFYYCFIQQMKKWLSDPHLPAKDFIKLVFYTGLLKKSHKGKQIMQMVSVFAEENIDLQLLPIEELSILANAFYKTGTKIMSPKLLATIHNTMINNMDLLLRDPALFITLVKAIRHAQNYNYELLDVVSSMMLSNKSTTELLGFAAKSHLLAWYAGTLYKKLDILSFLVKSSQKDLKSTFSQLLKTKKSDHLSIHHRSKDLSRFLWSLSYLNYTPKEECVETTIIPELRNRFKRGEYIKKPNEIIDALLSLWILGFKDETLLADVVSSKTLATLENGNKLYYNSRLALLLTCASIEAPGVLNAQQLSFKNYLATMSEPNVTRNLLNRPQLRKVYSIVSCLLDVLKASGVSCKYIIPHLHIAGIQVMTESRPIYIEVLDPSVCLRNSTQPHGLMQLKLRLMKSLHYQVVVIDSYEIEKWSDESSSLYEYIEEKIVAISKW